MTDQKPSQYPAAPYYNLGGHDEHASALGKIAASWALVEHELCAMFILLLRAPPQRGHAAYYAIVNNNARISMLRAVTKDTTLEKDDRTKIEELLDQAQPVAGKRNQYIHKLWLRENEKIYSAEGLPLNFPRGKKRRVHPAEMLEVVDEILTLADDLGAFLKDFSGRYPIKLEAVHVHSSLHGKSS